MQRSPWRHIQIDDRIIPLSLSDCNHNTRGTHAYALSSVSIIYYWSVPSKTRCYIHINIHIWSNVDRKITPIKKLFPLHFGRKQQASNLKTPARFIVSSCHRQFCLYHDVMQHGVKVLPPPAPCSRGHAPLYPSTNVEQTKDLIR